MAFDIQISCRGSFGATLGSGKTLWPELAMNMCDPENHDVTKNHTFLDLNVFTLINAHVLSMKFVLVPPLEVSGAVTRLAVYRAATHF